MEQLNIYLRDFLNELDAIAQEHGELGDTECRECMTEALALAFWKQQEGYTLPQDLGLFSDEGNVMVRTALAKYISRAIATAKELGLNTTQERLAAFNTAALSVVSDEGNCADEYMGIVDDLDWLDS